MTPEGEPRLGVMSPRKASRKLQGTTSHPTATALEGNGG